MAKKVVAGIDLAGNENNRTGFCLLTEEFGQTETKAKTLFSNKEILDEIKRIKPDVIAIDGPLTREKKDRKADLELKKYGTLPLNLKGMQILAQRAYKLASEIKKQGFKVIEVLPRATSKIMGLEREALSRSIHQADSILAAITGFLYLQGKAKEVGDKEGTIVIPKPSRKKLIGKE